MGYSTDVKIFWKLLELPDAILYLDNDMCYIGYNFNDENEYESHAFDFGPTELVFMFVEKMNFTAERV